MMAKLSVNDLLSADEDIMMSRFDKPMGIR
jgi:hypothetical protein